MQRRSVLDSVLRYVVNPANGTRASERPTQQISFNCGYAEGDSIVAVCTSARVKESPYPFFYASESEHMNHTRTIPITAGGKQRPVVSTSINQLKIYPTNCQPALPLYNSTRPSNCHDVNERTTR